MNENRLIQGVPSPGKHPKYHSKHRLVVLTVDKLIKKHETELNIRLQISFRSRVLSPIVNSTTKNADLRFPPII